MSSKTKSPSSAAAPGSSALDPKNKQFYDKQLEVLNARVNELQKLLDTSREENSKLKEKINKLSEDQLEAMEYLQLELRRFKKDADNSKEESEHLKQDAIRSKEEAKEHEHKVVEDANKLIEDWKAKYDHIQKDLEQQLLFKDVQASLEKQLTEAKESLQTKEKENRILIVQMERKLIQQKQEVRQELADQVKEVVSTFSKLTETKVKDSTKHVIKENERLYVQLQLLSQKIENLVNQNENMKKKMSTLEEENHSLESAQKSLIEKRILLK